MATFEKNAPYELLNETNRLLWRAYITSEGYESVGKQEEDFSRNISAGIQGVLPFDGQAIACFPPKTYVGGYLNTKGEYSLDTCRYISREVFLLFRDTLISLTCFTKILREAQDQTPIQVMLLIGTFLPTQTTNTPFLHFDSSFRTNVCYSFALPVKSNSKRAIEVLAALQIIESIRKTDCFRPRTTETKLANSDSNSCRS